MSMAKQNTTSPNLKVRASIDINAAQQDIFNAWLDINKLTQWMFGADVREEKILKLEVDAREGGGFSFKVDRRGDIINHIGTYREIKPHYRLVFTWGIEGEPDGESVVSVDITPQGKGCRVDLVHEMDPKWEEYASRTEQGWKYMLGKLNELLA
jgi:uncharacterized protein YndB with AHSA1/START domain